MGPPSGSYSSVAHLEGGGKGTPNASEALNTALENLQSLFEKEDFDVLFQLFARISRGGSHACSGDSGGAESRPALPAGTENHEISHRCGVSPPSYFACRPSTASTAIPSSSLSLSSASMEPAGHPVPSHIQSMGVSCDQAEFHRQEPEKKSVGSAIKMVGNTAGVTAAEGGTGGGRAASPRSLRHKTVQPLQSSAPEAAQNSAAATQSAVSDSKSALPVDPASGASAVTPNTKARGRLNAAGTAVTCSRRSPRLLKTQALGTPQKECAAVSPSGKGSTAAQQPSAGSRQAETTPYQSSGTERSRAGAKGGKRRQKAASGAVDGRSKGGSVSRKRCRVDADEAAQQVATFERGTPRDKEAAEQSRCRAELQSGVQTPPKSGVAPCKRKCAAQNDNAVASASDATPGKQGGRTQAKAPGKTKSRRAFAVEEEADEAGAGCSAATAQQADAAAAVSGSGNQGVSCDADEEPACPSLNPHMKVQQSEHDEGAASSAAATGESAHTAAPSEVAAADVQEPAVCLSAGCSAESCSGCASEASPMALQHKVLRALPESTPQFDFGLFVVRAASLSKHVDDVFPLLDDDELMERSVVLDKFLDPAKEPSQRRGDRFMLEKLVAEIPKCDGVYRPFQDIEEAPWCSGVEAGDGKQSLSKKDVLLKHVQAQRKWNPFSIFGSSPPSVELEDVFGYEAYQKTAPSARVHHPLFRRLSQFYPFKDLYASLSREEWDKVSSAFRHHWHKQCRLDLDWTNDPLTVDEIMWMLEANQQVEDRSSDVYEAEICYCVTPNPNVGFGWNDPRCHRYKAPRPSMGCHILRQPELPDEALLEGTVASPDGVGPDELSLSEKAAT